MRAPVRWAAVALLAVGLAFAVIPMQCGREEPFLAGAPAPDLRFTDLEGREVALSSFQGHLVVLNLWATWCAPCLAELPSLDRLHRALSRDGLVVLAVSVDEKATDVAGFVKAHGLTLAVLRDPAGAMAARDLHATSYPTTFVIDAGGRLRERYLGVADWDLPEALDHFRALMSESTAPTR